MSNLEEAVERKKVQRDNVKRVNEALITAGAAGEVETVKRLMLRERFDPNYGSSKKGGVLFAIVSVPVYKFTTGHAETLAVLLKHPDIDPNGLGNAWTPLKVAVQNENRAALKLLLQHPQTIPEVDVTGLGCSPISFMERFQASNADLPVIKFIIDSDTLKCFVDLPSKRTIAGVDSRMRKYRTQKLEQRSEGNAKLKTERTSAKQPSSVGRHKPVDTSDPFGQLPSGFLPDRSEFVMNPTSFDNIVSATVYYFLGITGGVPNTLIGTISFVLWGNVLVLVFVALFAAKHVSKTRELVNARANADNEEEVANAVQE